MAGAQIVVVSDGAGPEVDEHRNPAGHPERMQRVAAAVRGIERAHLHDVVRNVSSRPATVGELERVHDADHLRSLEAFCGRGGGQIDADTFAVDGSWPTALRAAGAGLVAVEELRAGRGEVAFCAYRPPGHHAERSTAMGFCLVNNVAVTAASLVAAGERVMILDWDVHHGNGTQEIFWNVPDVLYVSTHQRSTYPGTGRIDETGGPDAPGTNLNLPLPNRSTGDVLLACLDDVIIPVAERFAPTWLLISAGFDAHRADPLADLSWTSADYAAALARVRPLVPSGRVILTLEGGYDLDALADSVGASLAGVVGAEFRPESPSNGGPGREVVDASRSIWDL